MGGDASKVLALTLLACIANSQQIVVLEPSSSTLQEGGSAERILTVSAEGDDPVVVDLDVDEGASAHPDQVVVGGGERAEVRLVVADDQVHQAERMSVRGRGRSQGDPRRLTHLASPSPAV